MKRRARFFPVLLLLIFALLVCAACSGKNSNANKKALIVVSFGSSFAENRAAAIDSTEEAVKNAFLDYDFFRAFTSQIIVDIYAERDNLTIMNIEQAIEKVYKDGYGEVLIVPTMVINGEEADQVTEAAELFRDKFEKLTLSKPLLSSYEDYLALVKALEKEMPKTAEDEAVVLVGHGTRHHGDSAYGALDYVFKDEGFSNVYVGTVEGFPTFNTVLKKLKAGGYKKVTLIPCMIVAGDHAHNDMAGGEEDSWKNLLKAEGYDVEVVLRGLGEYSAIQNLFVEHANQALAQK